MEKKKISKVLIPRAGFHLWIVLLYIIIIAVLDWKIAVGAIVLFAILAFYNTKTNHSRRREIIRYIEKLTFDIDSATKGTLLNFPLPLVVLEPDGVIVWYNSFFRDIFEGEDLLEKAISEFIDNLELEKVLADTKSISKDIQIENKHYYVLGNYVDVQEGSKSSNGVFMLYFIDNTQYIDLKHKYEEEQQMAAIISIDNYEDIIQNLEDANVTQIFAETHSRINNWVAFAEGIIKKLERDKYLFIFPNKHFATFEEKKFEILDQVKEIDFGNKIPVTLSIGIGFNGETLADNLSYATSALDIALGRGGDQVVFKNGDAFSFYGGKSKEIEKRTKVKVRVIAHALNELIDGASNIVIMGHENPDIDSMGAALGLYRVAKKADRDVNIVLNGPNVMINRLLERLEKYEEYDDVFINKSEAINRVGSQTLLIVVDTHKPNFTECPELLKMTHNIVVIDHHRKSADFIQDAVLTYQETYASSTCEMVTEILQYIGEKIRLSAIEAEALYAGIIVDTKNFTFKTGVRTFEAASFLKNQGVDIISVKQLFQSDIETYRIRSEIIKNAEITDDGIAIAVCPSNDKNAQLISAQAADELLELIDVNAAFVLYSIGSDVFISGRSFGDINVQVIMEKLGGGGHMTVAGTKLQDATIEDIRKQLMQAISEYSGEA